MKIKHEYRMINSKKIDTLIMVILEKKFSRSTSYGFRYFDI